MASSRGALHAYLSDHMAGSVTASDLAKRGASKNDGLLRAFFSDLGRDIDADRQTLGSIASRVGVGPHPVKQAAAMAAERFSRFRIDHRMTGNRELSLLLELELLYLGIQGKHALWRALEVVAEDDARLADVDFEALAKRATQQLDAVEGQRQAIVRKALAA